MYIIHQRLWAVKQCEITNGGGLFLFQSLAFVCKAHLPAVGHKVHGLRNVMLCMSNTFLYLLQQQ